MTAQNAVVSGIKALLAKQKRPNCPEAGFITSPFDPGGWSVAVSAFYSKPFSVFFNVSGSESATGAQLWWSVERRPRSIH